MATKNNISTGIEKIKAAAKNPANSKLFDAFITGALSEDTVNPVYMDTDVEFSDVELENVCKLLTRERIGAYQNDVERSAKELITKYLKYVCSDETDDQVIEINKSVMTDILGEFSPDIYEDDDALKISVSVLFRNVFKTVFGTPVETEGCQTAATTAANESVNVDNSDVVNQLVIKTPEISKDKLAELQIAFDDMKVGNMSKTAFYNIVKGVTSDKDILNNVKEKLLSIKVDRKDEPKFINNTSKPVSKVESTQEKPKAMNTLAFEAALHTLETCRKRVDKSLYGV